MAQVFLVIVGAIFVGFQNVITGLFDSVDGDRLEIIGESGGHIFGINLFKDGGIIRRESEIMVNIFRDIGAQPIVDSINLGVCAHQCSVEVNRSDVDGGRVVRNQVGLVVDFEGSPQDIVHSHAN